MSGKFSNFYKVVSPRPAITTMTDSQNMGDQGTYANYTFYQRLIQGSASRITRYREYDMADYDVEIARSLDTIAEEMIGNNTQDDLPVESVIHNDKATKIPNSAVSTITSALRYWVDFNELDTRLFYICRVTIKYGDCFFIKSKERSTWEYVHPKNVVSAIVDQRDMTKVLGWQIKRDFKVPNSPYSNQPTGQLGGYNNEQVDTYPAEDIVWFTLNDTMSEQAPFGESVLRAVYKAQKQKELIEDSVIIYRVSRAPERRVFYVDVGKMMPHRVKAHLEQFKNEARQKKMPSHGGGSEQVDSVYNPMSTSEDIFLATRDGGRGTKVETLPGGSSTGVIDDLEYFQWKVYRGLRIPLSYMREGADNAMINDGANAYIAELRFAMYVQRLQKHINKTLDHEFKFFLRESGIKVDPSTFSIKLPDPENFGKYRQQKLDAELLNVASNAASIQSLSQRFVLERYLQLSQSDIKKNERMRFEEMGINPDSPEAKLNLIYQSADGGIDGGGSGMIAGSFGDDFGSMEPGLGGDTSDDMFSEDPNINADIIPDTPESTDEPTT